MRAKRSPRSPSSVFSVVTNVFMLGAPSLSVYSGTSTDPSKEIDPTEPVFSTRFHSVKSVSDTGLM